MNNKDEALTLALEALENGRSVRAGEGGTKYGLEAEAIAALRAAIAQPVQETKLTEIFCGVDYADGILSVSVMRRRPDDVAEFLHCEQIELAQPVQPVQEPVDPADIIAGALQTSRAYAYELMERAVLERHSLQPAAQAEPNEADQLLTALRLDPDTYRTDGGWLNIPKIMAAIASPADYPYTKEQRK